MSYQSLLSESLLVSLSVKGSVYNNCLVANFVMDFNVRVWVDSSARCWHLGSPIISIRCFVFHFLLVFESMLIPSCLLLFLIQRCNFRITPLSIVWSWLVQGAHIVLNISLSEVIGSISLTWNALFAINNWVWRLLYWIPKSIVLGVSIEVAWNEWVRNVYFKTVQIVVASITDLWFLSCVWPLLLAQFLRIFRLHFVINTKSFFACSFRVNSVELLISLG